MSTSPVFPPQIESPFSGPLLECFRQTNKLNALRRRHDQLEAELGEDHPHTVLVRSWHAVQHGSESFEPEVLSALRETEGSIREHFPGARRALAANLAAQGCCAWYCESQEAAIPVLQEAFRMAAGEGVLCDADLIKLAEVLGSSLANFGRYDEALHVLATAYPHFFAALEQSEWIAMQYDEYREQFLAEFGEDCSEELWGVVDALRGPRVAVAPLTREVK